MNETFLLWLLSYFPSEEREARKTEAEHVALG